MLFGQENLTLRLKHFGGNGLRESQTIWEFALRVFAIIRQLRGIVEVSFSAKDREKSASDTKSESHANAKGTANGK